MMQNMKRTALFLTIIGLSFFVAIAQQPQHRQIQIDPKTFDEFVGQYVFDDNPEVVLSFFREGDKFFVQPATQLKLEIFPEAENRFFLKGIDAQATFQRDAQNVVTGVVWRQGGHESSAKRASGRPVIEAPVPFQKREEMIRMRDGVRLHTLIFTPKNQTEPLPMIFHRTPYGI